MGGEGEGSGVKEGGKWGLGYPLSTPSKLRSIICSFRGMSLIGTGVIWLLSQWVC